MSAVELLSGSDYGQQDAIAAAAMSAWDKFDFDDPNAIGAIEGLLQEVANEPRFNETAEDHETKVVVAPSNARPKV